MISSKKAKELIEIFKGGYSRSCISFFAQNDYKDDTEIIELVKQWCELAYSCRNAEQYAKKAGLKEFNRYVSHREVFYAAEFALGKLTEKTARAAAWSEAEELYTIAKRHGDEWIARWCKHLKKDCFRSWILLRRFYLQGLCERPEEDEYYIGLMFARSGDRDNMPAFLRANPDLLEYDIWKFFEIEGNSQTSMANSFGCTNWNAHFKELSDEGVIARSRLLECSLQALARDFIQFRAGWYSRFHEYMKPTLEEKKVFKDYYLRLCSSVINPTVSFALKQIAQLEKAGAIGVDELLDYLPPALNSKTKAVVKKSVSLLEKQIKKNPDYTEKILVLICSALCHESPDIQEAILEVLNKHQAFTNSTVVSEIETYSDLLTPAIRAQLPGQTDADSSLEVNVDELRERASHIAKEFQQALQIQELISALDTKKTVVVEALDLNIVPPYFNSAGDFSPIQTLDELIDCCHLALENHNDILLLERILEAIGRFGYQKPSDFAKKTKPLLKQCNKNRLLLRGVHMVFNSWITGEKPPACDADLSVYGLWLQRLWWIADMVAKNKAFTLVSTPTHGHCIASSILKQRLKKVQSNEIDLSFALMRMYPIDDTLEFALKQKNAKKKVQKIASILKYEKSLISAQLQFERKRGERSSWVSANLKVKDNKVDDLWGQEYAHRTQPFALLNAVFPSHPELLHFAIANFQVNSYSWVESGAHHFIFYEQINHPDVPFTQSACLMLGIGLFSLDKYLRGLAEDLLVEAIADGRLGVKDLQWILSEFCQEGFAICKRIVAGFRTASEISPLHVVVIRDAILGCIPCIKEIPRDFHCLLDVLRDLLVQSGAGIKEEKVRNALAGWKGSTKTAKLAKTLLAYEETSDKKNFDYQVTLTLLESRLERMERWNQK